MQQDAGNVADDFANKAKDHRHHVAPCLVTDAEVEVYQDIDGEDGGEQGIAAQVWNVVEVRERQIADLDVTEFVWIEEQGDVAIRGVIVSIPARNAVRGDE